MLFKGSAKKHLVIPVWAHQQQMVGFGAFKEMGLCVLKPSAYQSYLIGCNFNGYKSLCKMIMLQN